MSPIKAYTYIRSKSTSFKQLTPVWQGYLAALIDGEGGFIIGNDLNLSIQIANTSPRIVDLCNVFSGFWRVQKGTRGRRPVYYWVWSIKMCKYYLSQIAPHIVFKREEVKIFLEALSLCYGRRYVRDKTKLMELRRQLMSYHTKGKRSIAKSI